MLDADRSTSKPVALHFGAGNIGRGFIGALLADAGYHVVFSDVDASVVDALNRAHAYRVDVLEADSESGSEQAEDGSNPGDSRSEIVIDVEAVNSRDEQDVVRDLAHPNTKLVTTAVGAPILEKVAPTLAHGIRERMRAGAGTLNVIACENMVHNTAALKKHVYARLGDDDETRGWADAHVGFADCSVDRIVPGTSGHNTPVPSQEPALDVGVEAFAEWVVDERALRTPLEPRVESMVLTDNLDAYIERKLFTLNCGHAATAYLGFLRGYTTIDVAVRDPAVGDIVRGALREGGRALVKKHGFDEGKHEEYIEKIMKRFGNPRLGDRVERVGKQPLRKLGRQDRLLGPAYMAKEYGMPIDNLAQAIAAVFLFDVKEDEESVRLIGMVMEKGIESAVAEVTGFEKGTEEYKLVVEAYRGLKPSREN